MYQVCDLIQVDLSSCIVDRQALEQTKPSIAKNQDGQPSANTTAVPAECLELIRTPISIIGGEVEASAESELMLSVKLPSLLLGLDR